MTLLHMMLLILILDRIARLFEAAVGIKGGQVGIGLRIRLGLVRLRHICILTKTGGEFQGDRLDAHLGLNSTGVLSRLLENKLLRGIDLGGASRSRGEGTQDVLGGASLEDRMSALSSSFIMPDATLVQRGTATRGGGRMKSTNIGRGLDLLFPGQRTGIHGLRTVEGAGILFLKEFGDLTGFHQRISIMNRHYRMAYHQGPRRSQEWLDILSTEEGTEAIGVFAGEIVRCRAVTRTGAAGATVGCRWWQLVYAILVSLPFPPVTLLEWNKGVNRSRAYDEMVEQARAVARHMERSRFSTIYRLLYRNEAVLCGDKAQDVEEQEPCLRPMGAGWITTSSHEGKRYYVCTHRNGVIGHYFVLERRRDSWYILSSYGSEWVRVPLRIHPVTEEELEGFLVATKTGDRSVVNEFFLRYFLEGGLPQRYSEDEPDRVRGRVIPLNVGIRRELEIVTREPFEVGYIDGMEETIRSVVQMMEGGRQPRLATRELAVASQPRLATRERRAKQRRSMRRRTVRRMRTNRSRRRRILRQ
jgi:hypothetical protein